MSASFHSPITDELLSAYLDNALSVEEKALVDTALQREPTVARRLESLRQTINLLQSLPAVSLPRSFTLSELQLAEQPTPAISKASVTRPVEAEPAADGLARLWANWRAFWQVGTPWLRNAAAVSFALFLIVLAGDYALPTLPTGATTGQQQASSADAHQAESAVSAEQTNASEAEAEGPTIVALEAATRQKTEPTVVVAAANDESTSPNLESDSANPPAITSQPSTANSASLPEVASGGEDIGGSTGATQALQLPEMGRAPGPDLGQESLNYQSLTDDQPLIAESLSTLLAATASVTNTADLLITATVSAEANAISETALLTKTVPLSESAEMTAGMTISPVTNLVAPSQAQTSAPEVGVLTTDAEQSTTALPIFQLVTGGFALLFALLWWRSRSPVATN